MVAESRWLSLVATAGAVQPGRPLRRGGSRALVITDLERGYTDRMNGAPLPLLGLVPIVSGLLWLLGPADEGPVAFVLSVVPGALLLAGGVGTFALPGDLRTQQITALGGVVGVAVGVLALFYAGFGLGLLLLLLSAASFVAGGWVAQAGAAVVDDVPAVALNVGLAAKVAIDEAVLGTMVLRMRPPAQPTRHLSAEEVRRAQALFAERGWLEKPESFHTDPPPLDSPDLAPAHVRGIAYEHLSFESGFEPHADTPGRERWLDYASNRTAHAWVLRHSGPARPWLVCIHGYGMGSPFVDLGAFDPALLHRRLGLNLILPVLPLHGPRKIGRSSGTGFIAGFEFDTVHAEAQAMWDVRRILSWVRAQGAPAVGAYGLSLGGYTTALLACLDADLACAIPGIPAADFGRLQRRFATPMLLREAEAIGLGWDDIEAVLRVVSPLALEPLTPHDRRFLFAGTADRLVPPDQVRDLWIHWDRPRIVWYQGSHLSIAREPAVRALLREALETSLPTV